jgi:hypothetical protein
MTFPQVTTADGRDAASVVNSNHVKVRKVPRGTFWLGGLAAAALQIPLLAMGIYALTQHLGWGAWRGPLDHIFIVSLVFAGVPAFFTGGGVARLCAHRLAERPEIGVPGAVQRGTTAMAVAGIALALLCVVPLGVLPDHPRSWWPVALLGGATGAIGGAAVAFLASMRQRRRDAAAAEAVA